MKIRSHTGNLVEVREGMVIELGNPIDGCSAKPAGNRHIVNSLCDAELFDYECTMLSCPFMVGDEVQTKSDLTGDWQEESFIIETESMLDEINSLPGEFRHSNPDLRSKEAT